MSNRLFQGIIHQMKDAVDRVIGVIDENGVIISCSELGKIGESRSNIREELEYTTEPLAKDGYTYRMISSSMRSEYIVFVEGEDKKAESTVMILSVALSNIKNLHDERYDRGSFLKNVILDNIPPSDIYIKSKELRFDVDAQRIVFLIRFHGKNDVMPFEIIQNMFPDRNKDYVLSIGETDVVLVSEVKGTCDMREMEKTAQNIVDTLNTEFFAKVSVGIGTAVNNLKELASSYKEALIAIEVGKVFDTEKNVISYENLGIGRLIYQLPTTLCEMFLHEVFRKGSIESLDHETLITIQAFFDNNLNVSETARSLFVHRNTLVYRLDKIKKVTGLDLREFDHAITFKVAMMVQKYLTSKPTKY